ncbi:MAG: hypothetical protein ACOCNC_02540 [Acetivibrio ethanolgignens]
MLHRIIEIIKTIQPYMEIDEQTNLLEDILDSTSLLLLVSELEIEYDISIDMDEIEPSHFINASCIAAFIERKLR